MTEKNSGVVGGSQITEVPLDGVNGVGIYGTTTSLWAEVGGPSSRVMTHAAACNVLTRVESRCLGVEFAVKPIVIITFAGMAMLAGLAMMEAAAAIVVVAGLLLAVVGGYVFIESLFEAASGRLTEISNLYGDIRREAGVVKANLLNNPCGRVKWTPLSRHTIEKLHAKYLVKP